MKKVLLGIGLTALLFSCNTTSTVMKSDPSLGWKHSANIYEVNIRQYTPEGTFRAFEKELPRLKAMGVEVIWLMPVTPIAQQNKKGTLGSPYAAADYTAINPEFGTMEDFKHLVKEAHNLGFKVLIDWVANHTGWDHVWTKTHPEYYLRDENGNFKIAEGMDDIIELDYGNPQMRQAMIEAMKYWVTEGNIDGFRCDLAAWVELDFWKQARPELEKIRPLFFLGEYDELDNPGYGDVFDASYTWRWMHLTKDFYQNKLPLSDLRKLLAQYSALGDESMRAWFTSNHDENTWNGTEYEKYGDMAHALAVFSATWNGIPLVYNAQELPLKTKRLEFFEKDPIPWTGQYEMADFYKTLFTLKKQNPALRGGDPAASTTVLKASADDKVLAYLRKHEKNEVLVVLNLSADSDLTFTIDDENLNGRFSGVFENTSRDFSQQRSFRMSAYGYQVFVKP